MRTWRVGSFSMGGALIFLGIFIFLQRFFDWEPAFAFLSWWPFLLILLGIEILVYLFVGKEENKFVKYDIGSIIFTGFIGMIGLGLFTLQSFGLFDLAERAVAAQVREFNLPKYVEKDLHGIDRIVLDTGTNPIQIHTTTDDEVSLFGTYKIETVDSREWIKDVADYALIEKSGDTLFIQLKKIPQHLLFDHHGKIQATLIIPNDIDLQVKGKNNEITLFPRKIESNWSIQNAWEVSVQIEKEANLMIEGKNLYDIEETEWNEVKNDKGRYTAQKQIGQGDNLLTIYDTDFVKIIEK